MKIMEDNMTEMDKLDAALTEMGIEHTYDRNFDGGTQIIVCEDGQRKWDAICTRFSYGGRDGLLEVYGWPLTDGRGVRGFLTAEDVVELIRENTPCN